MIEVNAVIKYRYLSIICLLTITLLTNTQFSFAQSKKNIELGGTWEPQSAITFEAFNREFIFTNSAEDYHRSFQRLIKNYSIRISEDELSKVLLKLTEENKLYVENTVSMIFKEANEFSHFRQNHYYQALEELRLNLPEINICAAIEVALVNEVRKIVSVPRTLSRTSPSEIRLLYLINHARYELLSALLHDVGYKN
jgi:hypothetical protein